MFSSQNSQSYPQVRGRGNLLRTAAFALFLASTALSCPQVALAATVETTEAPSVQEVVPQPVGNEAPVAFDSETLTYDDETQTIIAEGQVSFEQAGRILTSDRVTYDLTTDRIIADGNVVILDANGDVHEANHVELQDDMKDGFIEQLSTVLNDGSRFKAATGHRVNGEKVVMRDASYTACSACPTDPDKRPMWQLKAKKVTHDNNKKMVSYNNATFEFLGLPIMYTPYFAHPDGQTEQQSGFLPPSFNYSSDLGASITSNYYWAIAPDMDATIGSRVFFNQSPMGLLEARKRFENAEIKMETSFIDADRYDLVSGETIRRDKELRGHIFANGLWNIDEKWRAGFDLQQVSDEQYLRQFDISSERVLESQLYAERFDDQDYVSARMMGFKDVRLRENPVDQPNILPEVQANFVGDPNAFLGGQWYVNTSALGLSRSGDSQDMNRLSAELGWETQKITSFGLVNKFTAFVRGDGYNLSDIEPAFNLNPDDVDPFETRGTAVAHLVTSLPMEKPVGNNIVRIEPIGSITLSPNLKEKQTIPNEDSQDVQIDTSNLFNPSRFPGVDRVEDDIHATYGVRTGIYTADGSMGELFLGQSYRFDETPIYPSGSGLDRQESDIVGEMTARYQDRLQVNYRFQLTPDTFSAERHEFDGRLNVGRYDLSTTYLFARDLEGTDIENNREQVRPNLGVYLNEEWKARTGFVYDFGNEEGLRRADIGIDYLGQCFSMSATARRNLTLTATGEDSTEFFVRFGFKNLGAVGTQANTTSYRN